MDRPIMPPRRSRRPLYLGLSAAAASALLATGLIVGREPGLILADANQTTPPVEAAKIALPDKPSAEAQLEAAFRPPPHTEPLPRQLRPEEIKPISKRLADAFEAVTGHRQTYGVTQDGHPGTVNPLKIVQLPFGLA